MAKLLYLMHFHLLIPCALCLKVIHEKRNGSELCSTVASYPFCYVNYVTPLLTTDQQCSLV